MATAIEEHGIVYFSGPHPLKGLDTTVSGIQRRLIAGVVLHHLEHLPGVHLEQKLFRDRPEGIEDDIILALELFQDLGEIPILVADNRQVPFKYLVEEDSRSSHFPQGVAPGLYELEWKGRPSPAVIILSRMALWKLGKKRV